MLVLGRKPGEAIDIEVPPSDKPTRLAVTLVRTNGVQCGIGLEAPREVQFVRREINTGKGKE